MIPIPKQGDKAKISNYRPLSLISNIAKIYERIMYDRILSFLHGKKFLGVTTPTPVVTVRNLMQRVQVIWNSDCQPLAH